MPKYLIRETHFIDGHLIHASPDQPVIVDLKEENKHKKVKRRHVDRDGKETETEVTVDNPALVEVDDKGQPKDPQQPRGALKPHFATRPSEAVHRVGDEHPTASQASFGPATSSGGRVDQPATPKEEPLLKRDNKDKRPNDKDVG